MINNILTILTPLLIISYVSGLRIVDFSTSRRKARFSVLYILLLWSIYFSLLIRIVLSYIIQFHVDLIIFFWLNIFISIMSVTFGMHYNKKFKECLKKIAIVDDTLEQLGITTDYQKLQMKIIWIILGWYAAAIRMTYVEIAWLRQEFDYNIIIASCITFALIFCPHLNFISDLIIATTLGYIGLKFDQINENLRKLTNECEITPAWEDHVLHSHQRRHLKTLSNKYMTWIVIHLHLELRKISCEINSIFGMQMAFKMGLYFGNIGTIVHLIFSTILENFIKKKKEYLVIMLYWNVVYALQVLLINCICERVSVKANAIGSFINRISYSTYDVEVRENISQLLLQVIQSPLRFYGMGLFQFGFKFLYGFSASIATVMVILVQAHTNRHC